MVALAQRTAIEHQVLRLGTPVGRPFAAQHVVPAVGEVGVALQGSDAVGPACRDEEQVWPAIQVGGLPQQRPVPACITIGEARRASVGLVHVNAEVECPQQRLVHRGRHAVAVARREGAHLEPVAQREVVVVGGQLAMHAIRQQIGVDVHQCFAQRERSPVLRARELREHHAGEKHRQQFERAVIPLGCQVRAQELDLHMNRLQQASEEGRIDGRLATTHSRQNQSLQAVDPVLHAPTGDVCRDEARRRDPHPAIDQLGPASHVAQVCAALPRLRQAGGVIELVQQDVPLDVGARVMQPIDRVAQRVGFPVELEAAVHQTFKALWQHLLGIHDRVEHHTAIAAIVGEQRGIVQPAPCGQKQRVGLGLCSEPVGCGEQRAQGVTFAATVVRASLVGLCNCCMNRSRSSTVVRRESKRSQIRARADIDRA